MAAFRLPLVTALPRQWRSSPVCPEHCIFRKEASPFADPEAGKGIRYLFTKTLRLQAGTHQVRVSLPEDEVGVVYDITLGSGSANQLVLEPVYAAVGGKKRPGFYGVTSFKEGISRMQVALNGKML